MDRMESPSMSFRLLLVSLGLLFAGCASIGMDIFQSVDVKVNGSGTGAGRVTSNEPAVSLDCTVVAGARHGMCDASFDDAGQGGNFVLIATPFLGANFTGWSGCNSAPGTECHLSFAAGMEDVSFVTTARFEQDATNTCNMTFGASDGYILCGETTSSCMFYRADQAAERTCDDVCAASGETCVNALEETQDYSCAADDSVDLSCDTLAHDAICECSVQKQQKIAG